MASISSQQLSQYMSAFQAAQDAQLHRPASFALTPAKPKASKAKRTRKRKTRFCDLTVGDVLERDNLLHTITGFDSDGDLTYERSDGHRSAFFKSNNVFTEDGYKLVPPARKTKVSFDDVILPSKDKQAILDAIQQLDHHELIFEKWGFGETMEKGRAVSMLFYGAPGTGKTLMAQAIADKFDYTLKTISAAEIESSEPGQAERNIRAFFDAANKDKKTVLLFDECDSLIADRRDVGMIIGAQINQLLTSLEKFEGIAIFTTNRLEKMDEALNRRLSLKLEFAMPDIEQRVDIWKRMFPKKAPIAKDVNWEQLASVEIAGGYIKNVVLRAARRAAASKERKITHSILVAALTEEVESMTDFQEAIASNKTPRMMGGGQGHQRRVVR